jgi:hypothetical protein
MTQVVVHEWDDEEAVIVEEMFAFLRGGILEHREK